MDSFVWGLGGGGHSKKGDLKNQSGVNYGEDPHNERTDRPRRPETKNSIKQKEHLREEIEAAGKRRGKGHCLAHCLLLYVCRNQPKSGNCTAGMETFFPFFYRCRVISFLPSFISWILPSFSSLSVLFAHFFSPDLSNESQLSFASPSISYLPMSKRRNSVDASISLNRLTISQPRREHRFLYTNPTNGRRQKRISGVFEGFFHSYAPQNVAKRHFVRYCGVF